MADISLIPKYHIYSDESSQTKHKFLVIGATVCSAQMAPHIASSLDAAIGPAGANSELKWGKAKRYNVEMYESVINAYFDARDKNILQFYALVVDTHKADHKTYNKGDHEIGFSKYLFTLLYKFWRLWKPSARLHVFLDDRTTKHTPEATRRMLNGRAKKETPSLWYDPYRQAVFCDSRKSRIIQLTDIMTGAVAFATNCHDQKPDAASYKISHMNLIAKRAKLVTLARPSPYQHPGFDIWHLDFDKAKKK